MTSLDKLKVALLSWGGDKGQLAPPYVYAGWRRRRRGKLQDRNCESARYPFDIYVGTYICYKDRRLGLTIVYLAISQFRCCVDGEIAR